MPPFFGFEYFLVLVDTFTGWVQSYSTRVERALDVTNKLLQEIILQLGLPQSLQSDNGSSFISTRIQSVAKALDLNSAYTVLGGPSPLEE